MAIKKASNLPILPKNLPKIITVTAARMDYSEVKLHIPKDKDGNTTLEKPWYVWFNFRNPKTGKFDNKSKVKKYNGINRYYKTISERKEFGKNLVATYTKLLQEGMELGEDGKNINIDIGNLVKKGLPEIVQQSLDVVRVTGNDAVHPGQIDTDNHETVSQLFELINVIIEYIIALPKKVSGIYSNLPKGKIDGINQRDAKK